MEFTIEPLQPRSLVRRMAPWTLALGLFSGGGYGVYRYAAPAMGADADSGGPLAQAEMQQLFGANDADASETKPFIATAASATTSPFAAAAPQQTYGNQTARQRYATPAHEETSRYGASDEVPATSTSRYGASPALPPIAEQPPVTKKESPAPSAARDGDQASRYGQALAELARPPVAVEPRSTKLGAITPVNYGEEDEAAPDDVTPPLPPAELAVSRKSAPAEKADPANPLRKATVASASNEGEHPVSSPPPRKPDFEAEEARAAFSAMPARPLREAEASPAPRSPFSTAAGAASPDAAHDPDPALADSPAPTRRPAPAYPFPSQPTASAAPTPAASPERLAAARPQPDFADEVAHDASNDSTPSYSGRTYGGAYDAAPDDSTPTPTPGLAAADGAGRPGERSLEGTQTPSLTIQKLAPAEIQVGKKCTFAIRVTNAGPSAAHNVQVRDETPQGTQLVGTAPKAAVTGSHLLWDLGTLSPGEERTLEMELMPTDEGEVGSVATISFAAEASAKARSTRPQLALRLSAAPRVMAGEMQVVEVEVTNPGSGPATGIMLLENIPDGVTHEAGPSLEFEVGTLAPGESKRLELNLRADKAGVVANTMTARGDASLETTATCEFEIIAPALAVSVDGPQRRYLERPATYTVSVTNPGTAAAKEVQLVTQLPKGLKFVSANNMGEYDASTHSVYWSLAELPANEQGTVQLTALPIEAGDQTLQVASRAQQGLEDRAETHVVVEGLAALSFEVRAIDQMVEVGGKTSYEITVGNQGSKAATNVQVTAIVPPGLRSIGGDGDAPHSVEGNRLVFAPVAQLPPKGQASFRVEVQGVQAGDQRLRIEVASEDLREPLAKEEITRVYADE